MSEIFFISQKNFDDFELIRSEIERVVYRACHGEFQTDDVKRLIRDGKAFAAYVSEGDHVLIACVWELVYYPTLTSINVMALGGKQMKPMWKRWEPVLKRVWRDQGAQAWQCETSIAMSKLLRKSGIGLRPIYVTSREML